MRLLRLAAIAIYLSSAGLAARFGAEHVGKIMRLNDPQISPDGKSIALVVSRANFEDNRYDAELVLIDLASHTQRTLSRDRRGLTQPRWSPDGARLAFLANVDGKAQIFVLPMNGGEAAQITKSPTGIQQYGWRPSAVREIAFVATDEAPKLTGEERHNRSFEIRNSHFLMQESPRPGHVCLIAAYGK